MKAKIREDKKIDEILQSSQNNEIKSPSGLYLKFQDLSPEEKRYIETQDKRRIDALLREKRRSAANKLTSPKDKFELQMEDFKKVNQIKHFIFTN
jgi:hypothetical protein